MRSPLATTVALVWRLFWTPSPSGTIIIIAVVVAAGMLLAASWRHAVGATVVVIVRLRVLVLWLLGTILCCGTTAAFLLFLLSPIESASTSTSRRIRSLFVVVVASAVRGQDAFFHGRNGRRPFQLLLSDLTIHVRARLQPWPRTKCTNVSRHATALDWIGLRGTHQEV